MNNRYVEKGTVSGSIEQFAQEIRNYDVGDFINSEEPYRIAFCSAQGKIGLFSAYSAEILKVVNEKTLDKRIVSKVEGKIGTYETMLINQDFANSIVLSIDIAKNDKDTADKVSVLPLMCGSGKSTALTMYIMNAIIRIECAQLRAKDIREGLITESFLSAVAKDEDEREYFTTVGESEYDGILIVTDSKERLHKIWNPSPDNKYIDEGIRRFTEEYRENWVSIITEENYIEEDKKQYYSPILCITTQRYFGWSEKEIRSHLVWGDENGKHRRSLIIFDEQPFLNEVRDISVDTINNIDTALRNCLDNEVPVEEKTWCCQQWSLFRDWFFDLLSHYEYDFEGLDTLYYEPDKHSITEDDDKFFDIIEKYRTKIRARDNDAYNSLYTVSQFMNSWSVFSHRDIDTGEYSNKFTVFVDNREKVTNLGAKVIVLDGTGDISSMYIGQADYIDIRNGENYLRPLSYLSIAIGDLGTSKEDFRKRNNDIAKTVLAYLDQQGYKKKDVVFFTYKGKESKFQARVDGKLIKNVAHFGDIRGKNDFTSENAFAQVGINRMQPVHYLVHVLGRNDDMRQDVARREPDSMYEQIEAIYQDDRYIEFMTSHILADIDQCMFRSAIRNSDNTKDVVYYLFYKLYRYPKLRTAIENRYKTQLGASIEYIKEKDIIEAANTGKAAWRIRQWLAGWDGELIKQKTILSQLKMSRSTFNTAIGRDDPELGELFAVYRNNANNMGIKGAWYKKTYSI